jgi:hypothetical protein
LRVGNIGISTPVAVAGGNYGSLTDLKTAIEGALTTAGLSGVVDVSLVSLGNDMVQFSLVPTSETPLGFANESLGLSGTILVTPAGDGGTAYEYASDHTFSLSVGGRSRS